MLGLVAVGLVATLGGFLTTGGLKKIKSGTHNSDTSTAIIDSLVSVGDKKPSPKIVSSGTSEVLLSSDTMKNTPTTSDMKVRVTSNPTANAKGTYSFSVTASNIPRSSNVVYSFDQGRRGWVSSNTGSFAGVAPDSHTVTVYALAKRDGKLVAKAETTVSGFDKLSNNIDKEKTTADKPKLSVNQVATMFRNCDPQLRYPDDRHRHPLIAKQINLSFSGLRSGDVKPQVINDIYDKLNFGLWKSVHVASLSYDNDNKVNGIHFNIVYPD